MSLLNCLPQTDMDCFYNSLWRKQYSKSDEIITNFSRIQEQIDNEMIAYIDSNCVTYPPISFLRNSYETRQDYYSFFKPYIDRINNIKDLTSDGSGLTSLAHVIRDLNQSKIYSLFSLCLQPNFQA